MKTLFLKREPGNKKLLLLFNGWSCDEKIFAGIARTGWDTLLCHSFDDFLFDTSLLEGYDTIYLYAWSLGVFAAEMTLQGLQNRITKCFAINGTGNPVSDTEGIPTKIFRGTRETLNERNLRKFRVRMCGGAREFATQSTAFPETDDIESLRNQLLLVEESHEPPSCLPWVKAFISSGDMIFPAANQWRYWEARAQIVETNGAHLPDFEAILSSTLPDTVTIRRQFHNTRATYDSNAKAQKMIAARLSGLLSYHRLPPHPSVLEIGYGTGILTRMYLRNLDCGKLTLLDLATVDLNIPTAIYAEADAERWMADCSEPFDLIVSASTIQWFTNLPQFLRDCRRRLRPGGLLALSGFTTGNLSEFDSLRPNPLAYPSVEDVKRMLAGTFSSYEVFDDSLRVTFPTRREALVHIKNTGVSLTHHQKGEKAITIRTLTQAIPCDRDGNAFLTYRPLYIIARP